MPGGFVVSLRCNENWGGLYSEKFLQYFGPAGHLPLGFYMRGFDLAIFPGSVRQLVWESLFVAGIPS